MGIYTSSFLCLGSTLAALVGVLLLGWSARRQRWRWLGLLLAALFLIGAGFGTAETVYQFVREREATPAPAAMSPRPTRPPGVSATPMPSPTERPSPTPTPRPSVSPTSLPTRTPWKTPTPRPSASVTPFPTFTPWETPTPRPSTSVTPFPTRTPWETPTPSLTPTRWATLTPSPSAAELDLGALAPSLVESERAALTRLDAPPRYVLNVSVDFEALVVSGTADIFYTNNENQALDALYLRLYPNAAHFADPAGSTGADPAGSMNDGAEMQVEAVNVDGTAAAVSFEDAERTVLQVPLPTSLPPDATTTLQIAFRVTVPRLPGRLGYTQGLMSLGHWFPMLAVYDDEGWNLDPYVALGDAVYSDVAFYVVHLTVPEGTVVAGTGVEVGRVLPDATHTTITYVSGPTRDLALALSRDYQTLSRTVGETTVRAFYFPAHEAGGRQALAVAAEALAVYEGRFGPYPYTELDVAETAFTVAGAPGGVEFPGIVFISSEFYRPGSPSRDALDVVVAHEVAHQWWYGVVGNHPIDEPWLDEALATYASILYIEAAQGRRAAEEVLWSQAVLPYQFARALGQDGPLNRRSTNFRCGLHKGVVQE